MNHINTKPNLNFYYLHYVLFFLITFLFFAFFADYIFVYQEKTSLFIFSIDYLIEYLQQPGSLVIYLGGFFSTFYYSPISGSVIVSLIICLIVFFTSKIFACFTDRYGRLLSLFAGATMFYLHTDYHFLLYNSIGVLLQLIFFLLFIKYLKGWLPVLISPILYFISGGFVWLLFIMYAIFLTFQDFRKAWIKILSLLLLNLLVIYILKEFILFQTFKTLIIYPLSNEKMEFQFLSFLPLVLFMILTLLLVKVKTRTFSGIKIPELIVKLFPALLTMILLVSVAYLRFDNKTKKYFQSERLFFQNNYDELIEFNTKNPSANILTSYLNNIALCEKGILNDQLFHFMQKPDGQTLFLKWEMNEEILRRGSYFYYTTGMINEAHRWAFENMVMKGFTPEDLVMLIKTELINGNYAMASKYIRILKNTFFYRKEAIEFERLLFNDKAVDSHPELGLKRKNRIYEDFFVITDDPYINIEKLQKSNSMNRNAFQYKLAYLLIRKNYQAIAAELPELVKYGFNKIPVHLEEAAIVYKRLNLGPLSNLESIHFDQQTELRFKQYLQTLSSYNNDLKIAEPMLRQKFGTTFWYWALFR